jgi:hypothetical protein
MPRPTEEYLRDRSVVIADSGCWEWTRAVNSAGRPVMDYLGCIVPVARAALMLWKGAPLAPGMVAAHKCDNPRCVNPTHLEEISFSSNLCDAYRRGRRAPTSFTSHPGRVPCSTSTARASATPRR